MKLRAMVATVCLCALVATASAAAPLADRLPAKTLAYVGWAGKTAAFDRSKVGQLTREPVADAIVKAIKQAAEENIPKGDELKAFRTVWDLASIVWKRPIAVALVDLKLAKKAPPSISAALLIDLGKDRAAFAKHVDALLEMAKKDLPTAEAELPGGQKYRKLLIKDEDAPPMALGYLGNVFFLAVGQDTPAVLAGVKQAESLQAAASFKAHFREVDGDDLLEAIYVDIATILKRVEPMMSPPKEEPPVAAAGAGRPARLAVTGPRAIMAALGVDKVKALAGSVRVVDSSLYSKVKLFTPAPHRGLLMLLAGGKLTDADIAAVPADATFFAAVKLSPQAVYDEIRRVIRTVDPGEEEDFLEGLKEMEDAIGVSVTKDLLPAMGDTWVLSSAPSQGGFLTGTTLTLTLKDPEKFAAALGKIEDVMKKQMSPPPPPEMDRPPPGTEERQPRRRRPAPAAIESVKIDGVAIRYLRVPGIMPVAPAWAVHKGRLHVAAWPQVVATAIQNEGKKPITRDPAFRALRKQTARGPSILTYCNTPQVLRQFYNLALVGWTLGANAAAKEARIAIKPDWLPVLSKLEKYLSASIGSVSADKDGITCESYESMPSPLAAAPVAAAVLFPALHTARGQARTAVSASKLKMIGHAIVMYMSNNNGQAPPGLAPLIKSGYIMPSALVSPHSGRKPPKLQGGKLIGEVDYIYVKLPANARAGLIRAYERPENHNGRGTNVLMVDGSVRWMSMGQFEAAKARTHTALGKTPDRSDF